MYYIFNIYMYYKRNTGGLWLHLGSTLLEKVFRPAHDIFKRKLSTDWISTHEITYCFLTDIVMFYNRFLTFHHSKLVGYACYLVRSLSTWFTHSLISHLSRLSTGPALPWYGGYLVAPNIAGHLISIHWACCLFSIHYVFHSLLWFHYIISIL